MKGWIIPAGALIVAAVLIFSSLAGTATETEEENQSVLVVESEDTVLQVITYKWTYDGIQCEVTLNIYEAEYEDRHSELRTTMSSISDFAKYMDYESQTATECAAKLAQLAAQIESDYPDYTVDLPNFVLYFVQSLIYYDDYESTGIAEYPKYPVETLYDGGGDCEDVAALYACMMHALGYETCMIYIPISSTEAHMMAGIAGDFTGHGKSDKTGTKYFIAECTKTGWTIGQVPGITWNVSTAALVQVTA